MAGVLHRVRGAAVAEHGVVRAGFERPGRAVAAGDGDGVAAFGAALGEHQVPALADPIQVRRFGRGEAEALPDRVRIVLELPGLGVQAALEDPVALAIEDGALPGQIAFAVLVPAQVGVDAGRFSDEHRLAPQPRRIGGGHDRLARL
ncbi:hypothetical protein GCM10029992_48020 [Glycomyces albus]